MAAAGHTRVWDPLVRTVHWSLAALIAVELFNEAGANPWHRYLGYVAAARANAASVSARGPCLLM